MTGKTNAPVSLKSAATPTQAPAANTRKCRRGSLADLSATSIPSVAKSEVGTSDCALCQ